MTESSDVVTQIQESCGCDAETAQLVYRELIGEQTKPPMPEQTQADRWAIAEIIADRQRAREAVQFLQQPWRSFGKHEENVLHGGISACELYGRTWLATTDAKRVHAVAATTPIKGRYELAGEWILRDDAKGKMPNIDAVCPAWEDARGKFVSNFLTTELSGRLYAEGLIFNPAFLSAYKNKHTTSVCCFVFLAGQPIILADADTPAAASRFALIMPCGAPAVRVQPVPQEAQEAKSA